jgi:signal transduction histidine kinase
MFERLDNSLEAKAGSGLGLAIARGLARGLGGDLTCSSAAPHGACFTLFLPCEEPR